ncbi:hypothetical protein [Limnochorda pilosa]|uniref:Uncharacterized protein n=1 Tax=Limnochorda pilosa TaxID=1555112 RepID=A0A0K2SNH2_LIMPI|nr:hypothetical protein [Limnochorda pilosa]BAS28567.1 hypothetical protein LIP_2737 [Limnochorda pilosa]
MRSTDLRRGWVAGLIALGVTAWVVWSGSGPEAHGAELGSTKHMYASGPASKEPPAVTLTLYDREGQAVGKQRGMLRHALWASSEGSWVSSSIPPLGWPDRLVAPGTASAELDFGAVPPAEVTVRLYAGTKDGGFPQEPPAHEFHCRLDEDGHGTCSYHLQEPSGRMVVTFNSPAAVPEWFVTVQAYWPRMVVDAPLGEVGPGGMATWGFRLSAHPASP